MSIFLFFCLMISLVFLISTRRKANKLQTENKNSKLNEVALKAAENELQFLKNKLKDLESTEASFKEGINLSAEKSFVENLKNNVANLELRERELIDKLTKAKNDLTVEANTKEQNKEKLQTKIEELEQNGKKSVEQLESAKREYLSKLRDVLDREKFVKEKLENSSSGIQAKLHEVLTREGQAAAKMFEAKELLVQAQKMKAEAEKHVEVTKSENLVYQAAIEEVVNLWVNDSWKSIVDKLTPENYGQQKARMEKVFDICRKNGVDFDGRQERAFYVRMESAWKEECVLAKAKEEQARIREIMKEEQRAEKARASELKKLEQERKEQEKLHEEHLERIKMLKEMEALKQLTVDQQNELDAALADNEKLELEIAENERRKSMAEMTKAGHVYVISNLGSFGKDVFKVGMTRRLIPEERVKELGDASVPFPFDVHMMVATEDAPALEFKLHEELWKHRMNMVNDGKEFFSVDLKIIKELVDKHSGNVVYEYKEFAQASQWRESEVLRKSGDVKTYKPNSYHRNDDEEAA